MKRNRTPAKPKKSIWDLVVQICIPIAVFLGSAALFGFNTATGLATKPYVDDRFLAAQKYSDEKAELIRKDAYEHSDTNRREMQLEMSKMQTAQATANAELATKVNLVLDTVRAMRDDAWSKSQRRPLPR